MAVNAGSRGVMARLGMTHVRTDVEEWEDPLPGAELRRGPLRAHP